MAQTVGVEKGQHVPTRNTIKDVLKDKEAANKEAAKNREWIQKGMREDAAKSGNRI